MKAVQFKGQNKVLGEGEEGITPLPIFVDQTNEKFPVVTCWQFENKKERNKFLRTGKIYITQGTYGKELNPMSISANNPIVRAPITKEEKEEIKKNALEIFNSQKSN